MKWFPLLLISCTAYAGIFGNDDREESRALSVPSILRDLSYAVPAIVENKTLINDGTHLIPKGFPLLSMGFCPEARFSDEQYVARCSASLIGEDLVLTAGHCIDDDLKKWCEDYSVVFDYVKGETIREDNVYHCQEVLYRKFVGAFDEDLAVIRLKKKVSGREPIRIASALPSVGEKLSMIGYPLGISQKVADNGNVTQYGPSKYTFRHDVDTFSSNSGGPLFNSQGEQVGVLVRGTGANQDPVDGRNCFDWGIEKENGFSEANTLLHLPRY